jgi:flavin-dependent dehydrogenase
MTTRFDMCVLGGGPAGCALAILMARRGARVALVEKTGFETFRPGEHLPPRARGALRALGCEAHVFDGAWIDSPGILSRWIAPASLFKPYVGDPDGLGLNLSRRQFDQALFRQAARAGVVTHERAALTGAARDQDGWTLTLRTAEGPRALAARLVADASGRSSIFARRQGARWRSFGDLIAAAGRLRPAQPGAADNLSLRVEACEHGWWSLASTRRGEIVATFYGAAAQKRAMALDEQAWWRWGLDAAPGMREILAQTALGLEQVLIYPAFPRLLRRMHGPGWLAVGDAAAAHDPLSGHGVVYAFESAFRAAEMASAELPLERIGPLYQEAITGRFARHMENRRAAYAEAAPLFPRSPFWHAMAAPRDHLGRVTG